MNKLFAVFKVVSIAAAGMVGATVTVLFMLFLVMRGSLPYRTAEWLLIFVSAAAVSLVAGGSVILLYAGWREADAEHSLRPLPNQHQTRFLVEIPSVKRYGVLDIQANAINGLIIGQNNGTAPPLTPISYDFEHLASGQIPFPEPYQAGNIMNEFFRAN